MIEVIYFLIKGYWALWEWLAEHSSSARANLCLGPLPLQFSRFSGGFSDFRLQGFGV